MARAIRRVWLTDMVRQVHVDFRGTYGSNRIHAEFTMGYGIALGRRAVAMLMRRAGLAGLPGARRRRKLVNPRDTAADMVDRNFIRTEQD